MLSLGIISVHIRLPIYTDIYRHPYIQAKIISYFISHLRNEGTSYRDCWKTKNEKTNCEICRSWINKNSLKRLFVRQARQIFCKWQDFDEILATRRQYYCTFVKEIRSNDIESRLKIEFSACWNVRFVRFVRLWKLQNYKIKTDYENDNVATINISAMVMAMSLVFQDFLWKETGADRYSWRTKIKTIAVPCIRKAKRKKRIESFASRQVLLNFSSQTSYLVNFWCSLR